MASANRMAVALLIAGVSLRVASGCGPDQGHPPYLSATCTTPPCSPPDTVGGNGGPPTTTPDAAAAVPTTTADAGVGLGCTINPVTLIQMCIRSTACPGITIDPVTFNGCGFIGTGVDVECVCNASTLCPIAVGTSCSYLQTQLQTNTLMDICAPALTGACRDVSSLMPTGSGGTPTCDRTCAANCANSPPCLQACGC